MTNNSSREHFMPSIAEIQVPGTPRFASPDEEHNESLPVEKLHDEILIMIFKMAVPRHRFPVAVYLLLSFVCSSWRRIIVTDAGFWRDIQIHADSSSLDSNLQLATLCLDRSAGTTVSFRTDHGWMPHSIKPISLDLRSTVVPSFVLSNMEQVREIGSRLSPDTLSVFTLLLTRCYAPDLEALHLSIVSLGTFHDNSDSTHLTHEQTDEERIDLSRVATKLLASFPMFSGVFPKLRKVGFMGFHVPWDSYMYTDLTYLSLGVLNFREPWAAFLRSLSRCPRLEFLHLSFTTTFPIDRFCTHVHDLPPISLRNLTVLNLLSVTITDLKHFFTRILISKLLSFDIAVSVYPGLPAATLFDILNALPSFIQTHIHSVETLHIINTYVGTQRLIFHIIGPDKREFPVMISLFDPTKGQTLKYTLHSIFSHFPAIKHLELTGDFKTSLKDQFGYKNHITTLTLHHDHNEPVVRELKEGGGLADVTSLNLDDIYPLDSLVYKLLSWSSRITKVKVSRVFEQYTRNLYDMGDTHGVEVKLERIIPPDYEL